MNTNDVYFMPRRSFLKNSMLMVPAAFCLHSVELNAARLSQHGLGNFGIQLYTVRDQMKRDVEGTLRSIAEIGYKEVEFAGYFGSRPKEIKNILSENLLTSPSTHIEIQLIRDYADQVIETALEVGHKYIVMAWLDPSERVSLDQYRAHADLFSVFGEKCKTVGLKFAFHNHDFDFQELEGEIPMDLLLKRTDPDIVAFELDMYWITKAKADPLQYIKNHPGRFPLWHIKDMAPSTKMADVGAGIIDFSAIFALNKMAGLEHFFAERDDPPDSLVTASNCFNAMLKLEY